MPEAAKMYKYHTFKIGRVFGKMLSISRPQRDSIGDCDPNKVDIVHWGKQSCPLDDNLNGRLEKLIPQGYGTPRVTANDWKAFVSFASLVLAFK